MVKCFYTYCKEEIRLDENKEKLTNNGPEELSEEDIKIRQEMEELAKTFQQELDKAKAEEEELAREKEDEQDILIQELDEDSTEENVEDIPEDELCECCGAKRRGTEDNPDSPYCSGCEQGLRRYPFDFLNIIIVLFLVALSLAACVSFAGRAKLYAEVGRADRFAKHSKLYSASAAYETALKDLKDKEIGAEMVYQRQLENIFKLGTLDDIAEKKENFKEFEIKLPHLRKAYNIFKNYDALLTTQQDGYSYIYEYQDVEDMEKDFPYDEVIAKLEAMRGKEIKQSAQDTYTEDGETTTAVYKVNADKYDESMIDYLEYVAASICNKDADTRIAFLETVRQRNPEYVWMYAVELGLLYAKQGKDTSEMQDVLAKTNSEDSSSDLLKVISLRIKGEYDEAIAAAQPWIDAEDDYAFEFLRQQALCYLCKEQYQNAYKVCNTSFELYNYSAQAYYTMALCCCAAGKTDNYEEIRATLESYGMPMSDEVVAYMNGTATIESILTQGDYDV